MGARFGCCIDEQPEALTKRNTDPAKLKDKTKHDTPADPEYIESDTATYTSSPIERFYTDSTITSSSKHHDIIEPDDTQHEENNDHQHILPNDDNDDVDITHIIQEIQLITEHITKQQPSDDVENDEKETKEQQITITNDEPQETLTNTDNIHNENKEDAETTPQEQQITITSDQNEEKQQEHEEPHEHIHDENKETETTPNTDDIHDDDKEQTQDEVKQLEMLLDESDEDNIVKIPANEHAVSVPIITKDKEEVDSENEDTTINTDDIHNDDKKEEPQQYKPLEMIDNSDESDENTVSIAIGRKDNDSVDSVDSDEEDRMMRDRMLLKRYKSQREMLDDESIDRLLKMELPQSVQDVMGDRQQYELPSHDKEDALFHLERDLRKIKYALKEMKVSEERKYAKITILKHYHILSAVYTKYCTIGGDRHWLNYDGYISLLRDVGIITIDEDDDQYKSLFHATFEYHSKYRHNKHSSSKHQAQLSSLYGGQSFHDNDPWTGIWCLVKDKQRIHRMEKKRRDEEEKKKRKYKMKASKSKSYAFQAKRKVSIKERSELYFEQYKMRKIGDKRIVGCMNNINYAEIGGTFEKSNYKKAKIEIKFKKRRIKVYHQRRVWFCELVPPKSIIDDIKMKVKWEEINENSSRSKQGKMTLYKHDELHDNDIDIPKSQYVGLSRSEFLDAMLRCSHILHDKQMDNPFIGGFLGRIDDEKDDDEQDLYISFDKLVTQYLDEYIYKNHCELERYLWGKEIEEDVKDKLRAYNTVLMKLFKKYASLDNSEISTTQAQEMDSDEWCAMAVELCKAAKSFDKSIWKHGGKPSMIETIQCFTLSKNETLLNQDAIGFVEFQRCLIIFTNFIFKYHPGARYDILDFHDKLDVVLKWCEKLEAQKIRLSSAGYMRSDTLKRIKRNKSLHQNVQSNQSFASTPSPRSDAAAKHTLCATYTNIPDMSSAMNHNSF